MLALVGWFVVKRGGDADVATTGPTGRTQSTVLLEVGGQPVTGLALLASDPATGEGAVVLVPNSLMVDVAGVGPMTLGQAAALAAGRRGRRRRSPTASGSRSTAPGRSTPSGLAALVDAVGGVTVTVDTDITGRGATEGSTVVLIPAGTQTLDGVSAATYAAFLGADEPEQSRLARLDSVLSAVIGGLPADSGQVTLQLGALGAGSASTMPEQLAPFLAGLRSAEQSTSVVHRTLPVRSIDAGGASPSVGIDADASAALVSDLLSSSVSPQRPGGDVRVLVQNGVGTPGLGSSARDLLVAEGFTYVPGGNAASFGTNRSVVLIADATADKRAEGAAVAEALGLPTSSLRITARGQSIADVVVILGARLQALIGSRTRHPLGVRSLGVLLSRGKAWS